MKFKYLQAEVLPFQKYSYYPSCINSYSFQDLLLLALRRQHSKKFVFYCGNLKSRNIQKIVTADARMGNYGFLWSLKALSTQVESAIFVLYSILKIYLLSTITLACFVIAGF